MNIIFAFALCVLTFTQQPLHLTHEQQIAVFQEAQVAYDLGITLQTSEPSVSKVSFLRATERFQLLIDDGIENGKLWYNLGNAYLQSKEIGEAIAAYRNAQRYIPSNGRLQANLQYARTLVNNPVTSDDTSSLLKRLAFWHWGLPTHIRIITTIVLWSILWIVFAIRVLRKFQGFKPITIAIGCIAVAFGLSVGIDIAHQHEHNGVIVASQVIVRKGNGMNYAPMFQKPIHEGIEFTIIEERGHWLYIQLPNGAQGWIQEDEAMIVSLEQQQFESHS